MTLGIGKGQAICLCGLIPLFLAIYTSPLLSLYDHFKSSNQRAAWLQRFGFSSSPKELSSRSPADYSPHCPEHSYTVHILSTSPLLLHIGSFVTPEEASHLLSLTNFSNPSLIGSDNTHNSTIRSSHTSILNEPSHTTDPVIRCILARAAEFQAFAPHGNIEAPQIVRYRAGEHFSLHHDAMRPERQGEANRQSSFFVVLKAEDVGDRGGTFFPFVDARKSGRAGDENGEDELCGIIRCKGGRVPEPGEGISVKPVAGSATFWINLKEDGSLIREVMHAGERLGGGIKYGMNIWTWTDIIE